MKQCTEASKCSNLNLPHLPSVTNWLFVPLFQSLEKQTKQALFRVVAVRCQFLAHVIFRFLLEFFSVCMSFVLHCRTGKDPELSAYRLTCDGLLDVSLPWWRSQSNYTIVLNGHQPLNNCVSCQSGLPRTIAEHCSISKMFAEQCLLLYIKFTLSSGLLHLGLRHWTLPVQGKLSWRSLRTGESSTPMQSMLCTKIKINHYLAASAVRNKISEINLFLKRT